MPKKKIGKLAKQINVRVPADMYERVTAVAMAMGVDASGLTRIMYTKYLVEFEEEAEKIRIRRAIVERRGEQ